MPPSLSEYERLFLLEFFVDFVTIKNTAFSVTESTLCVSFQFLHFPVMRVCEEEFIPQSKAALAEDSKVVFKGGKSCLFSVHPDENNKISSTFNLIIAVCQRKKDCPNRQLIGQAAVNLGTSFLNLLEARTDAAFSSESSVKYDLYPLKDKFKRVVGAVAAFARLSNFGKMIITQFQLAAEDNMNYMFKGTDNKKLFKDDPMMDFSVIQRDQPRPSEEKQRMLSGPRPSAQRPRSQPVVRRPSVKQDVCSSSSSSDTSTSSSTTESSVMDVILPQAELPQPNISELQSKEPQNFDEIDAEINGHSITIRILKKNKPKEEPQGTCCCCPPAEPSGFPNAPKPQAYCPCCTPPNQSSNIPKRKRKSNSIVKRNISISQCPREDCPLNMGATSTTQIDAETAAKSEQAQTNKPAELSDKDKKSGNPANNAAASQTKQSDATSRKSIDKSKKKSK